MYCIQIYIIPRALPESRTDCAFKGLREPRFVFWHGNQNTFVHTGKAGLTVKKAMKIARNQEKKPLNKKASYCRIKTTMGGNFMSGKKGGFIAERSSNK